MLYLMVYDPEQDSTMAIPTGSHNDWHSSILFFVTILWIGTTRWYQATYHGEQSTEQVKQAHQVDTSSCNESDLAMKMVIN